MLDPQPSALLIEPGYDPKNIESLISVGIYLTAVCVIAAIPTGVIARRKGKAVIGWVVFALLSAAAPAWAGWVRVDEDGQGVVYLDPDTIDRSGDYPKVWALRDRRTPGLDDERSRTIFAEIDCAAGRMRILSQSDYSEQMAMGDVLSNTTNPIDWSYAGTGTAADIIRRFVCSR